MRTALVTGGTRGIGLVIANRLRASGVTVQTFGSEVDVRDEHRVADRILALGKIDILINNAGIFGKVGSPLAYELEEWNKVIGINLTGQFLVAKHVIPGMVKRGYGRVVNMSSVVVKDVNPNAIAYSCSKAAVETLTRGLALATAKTGVTVNCVRPAAVNTDLFKDVPAEQIAVMLKKCPMDRFIEADEVASLVCYLASEEASGMTGAAFDVAGGRCQP